MQFFEHIVPLMIMDGNNLGIQFFAVSVRVNQPSALLRKRKRGSEGCKKALGKIVPLNHD